jgi:hypothetical protein
VADQPDGIVLRRHRDLEGRLWHAWVRRSLVALLAAITLLALLGVFGQRPSSSHAQAAPARLSVSAPGSVRGGLLYQARFTVEADQALDDATLVLSPSWVDGITVNTIEPSPVNEASRNGSLALSLGHLPAGARHELFLDFQVNPTTVGSRTLRVELDDGEMPILTVSRDLRIYP